MPGKSSGRNSIVELAASIRLLVAVRVLLFRVELDHVVDSEDGDRGLRGELERFDLGNGRLEHPGLLVVDHLALVEIQAHPKRGAGSD